MDQLEQLRGVLEFAEELPDVDRLTNTAEGGWLENGLLPTPTVWKCDLPVESGEE